MKVKDIEIGIRVRVINSWACMQKKHRQTGMTGTIHSLPYPKDPTNRTAWFADIKTDDGKIESVMLCKIKAI